LSSDVVFLISIKSNCNVNGGGFKCIYKPFCKCLNRKNAKVEDKMRHLKRI
jgi:hypothetical protein